MSADGWDRVSRPLQLSEHVYAGIMRSLLPAALATQLPGPGSGTRAKRCEDLYTTLSQLEIRYCDEPTDSTRGLQVIRSIDQVLAVPKHGNCLDVCAAFAAGCLDCGLHPIVVVLDRTDGSSGHAIVVVWMDRDWTAEPGDGPYPNAVYTQPPSSVHGLQLSTELRGTPDAIGAFLAIDVAGITRAGGETDSRKDWLTSVADAAAMLGVADAGSGLWRWAQWIDIGKGRWEGVTSADLPALPSGRTSILVDGFRGLPADAGPLATISARARTVPFLRRAEFDVLVDWLNAHEDESGSSYGAQLALIYGAGGSGKTRLAAELCSEAERMGWYAGFLAKSPTPSADSLGWIGRVVSPTLVVIDYAEDTTTDTIAQLVRAGSDRVSPLLILMTSRSLGAWWANLHWALRRDALDVGPPKVIALPRSHPELEQVYTDAVSEFAAYAGTSPRPEARLRQSGGITTLDAVLQAYCDATAHEEADLFVSHKNELYDRVLEREFDYWRRVSTGKGLPSFDNDILSDLGAVMTLLRPASSARVTRAISVLPEFRAPSADRTILRNILTGLLSDDEGGTEGLAVRPDPVGEYLVMREMLADLDEPRTADEGRLLDRLLPSIRELGRPAPTANARTAYAEGIRELRNICAVISKTAERDFHGAQRIATALLDIDDLILVHLALDVSLNEGGAFASALESRAAAICGDAPPDHLPHGHGALRSFALHAVEASRPPAPADVTDRGAVGEYILHLNDLTVRHIDMGNPEHAVEAAGQVVDWSRKVADAYGPYYMAGLFQSLALEAEALLGSGRYEASRVVLDEADRVAAGVATMATDPRHRFGSFYWQTKGRLALAFGDLELAMSCADRDVDLSPAFERGASTWLVLEATARRLRAATLIAARELSAALDDVDKAVSILTSLATDNLNTFGPELARALNVKATLLTIERDFVGAVMLAQEAVSMVRGFAVTSPTGFRQDLGMSSGCLAIALLGCDRSTEALPYAKEAVTQLSLLNRQLPGAHLVSLIKASYVLAECLRRQGDVDELDTVFRMLSQLLSMLESSPIPVNAPLNSKTPRDFAHIRDRDALLVALCDVPVALSTVGRGGTLPLAHDDILFMEEAERSAKSAEDTPRTSVDAGADDGVRVDPLDAAAVAVAQARDNLAVAGDQGTVMLIRSLLTLGCLLGESGLLVEATDHFVEAVDLGASLSPSSSVEGHLVLGEIHLRLGDTCERLDRTAEAIRNFSAGIERCELMELAHHSGRPVDDADAITRGVWSVRAECSWRCAEILLRAGNEKVDRALTLATDAVELSETLLRHEPDRYRRAAAISQYTLSRAHFIAQESDAALHSVERSVLLLAYEVGRAEQDCSFHYVAALHHLSNCLWLHSRTEESADALATATEHLMGADNMDEQTCHELLFKLKFQKFFQSALCSAPSSEVFTAGREVIDTALKGDSIILDQSDVPSNWSTVTSLFDLLKRVERIDDAISLSEYAATRAGGACRGWVLHMRTQLRMLNRQQTLLDVADDIDAFQHQIFDEIEAAAVLADGDYKCAVAIGLVFDLRETYQNSELPSEHDPSSLPKWLTAELPPAESCTPIFEWLSAEDRDTELSWWQRYVMQFAHDPLALSHITVFAEIYKGASDLVRLLAVLVAIKRLAGLPMAPTDSHDYFADFAGRSEVVELSSTVDASAAADLLSRVDGGFGTARRVYESALAIDTTNALLLSQYADMLIRNSDKSLRTSTSVFERAVAEDTDGVASYECARFFIFFNNGEHAERALKNAVLLAPNDARYTGAYASYLGSLSGRTYEADQLFIRALALDVDNITNICNYALHLARGGRDPEKAKLIYSHALQLASHDMQVVTNYALMLRQIDAPSSEIEEAYRAGMKLIKTAHRNGQALRGVHPRFVESYAQFVEVVMKDPDTAGQLLELAGILQPNGEIGREPS